MAQEVSISEQIFKRWYEKLNNDSSVPKMVLKELELLHQKRELSDVKAIEELLKRLGVNDNDKN